jgi:hypothetical protein
LDAAHGSDVGLLTLLDMPPRGCCSPDFRGVRRHGLPYWQATAQDMVPPGGPGRALTAFVQRSPPLVRLGGLVVAAPALLVPFANAASFLAVLGIGV